MCVCALLHACVRLFRSNHDSHYCCHTREDDWTSQQRRAGNLKDRQTDSDITWPTAQFPTHRDRLTCESFDTAPSCGGSYFQHPFIRRLERMETGGRGRSQNSVSQRTNAAKINGRLFLSTFAAEKTKATQMILEIDSQSER